MLPKRAEIGILRIEVRPQGSRIGVNIRSEIHRVQILGRTEDPLEKVEIAIGPLNRCAEGDAVENALTGVVAPGGRRRVSVRRPRAPGVSVGSLFKASAMTASMSALVQRGSETNLPAHGRNLAAGHVFLAPPQRRYRPATW